MGNWLPPRKKPIIEDEEAPAADSSEIPPSIPTQNPSDMSNVGKVDDGDNMSETFLHKLIADVDAGVAKIAETEDGIQEAAKTFAEQLDESVRIENGDLNVEIIRQTSSNLYDASAKLLKIIEDGHESKMCAMRQINDTLHDSTERLLKPESDVCCVLKLDCYLRKVVGQTEGVNRKSLSERVKAENDTDLRIRVKTLESKVFDLEQQKAAVKSSEEAIEFQKKTQGFEQNRFEETQTHIRGQSTTNRVDHTLHIGDEPKQLTVAVTNTDQQTDELKKELDIAQTQVDKQMLEKTNLMGDIQEKIIGFERKSQVFEERANGTEKEIKSLVELNKMLKQEIDVLKLELQTIKSKKLMKIQIYSQQQNSLMRDIENELTALLKSRMSARNTAVEFVRCWQTSEIKRDIMLLTLCINVSRLGTDASNALSGVHVSPKVVMLVFHHKDAHALPTQTSDRILTEPSFRELSGILDIAFISGKGIYDCEMNEHSISQVMNFIERNIEGYGMRNENEK